MNADTSRVPSQDTICHQVEALIPAYALGAADPEEAQFVHRHLTQCPDAMAALAEYEELAEDLLYTVGPSVPPPRLAVGLRAALDPASPARAVPSPGSPTAAFSARLNRILGRWVGLAAAATAIVLLLLFNGFWIRQNITLQERLDGVALRLADQEAALAMLTEADRVEVEIPAADEGDAKASVVWSPEFDVVILYAKAFPPLPQEMAYQVWLIKDGERTSAGLFEVNATGDGALVFRSSKPLTAFDAMGITPEPAEGSSGPTAPPVVRGEL